MSTEDGCYISVPSPSGVSTLVLCLGKSEPRQEAWFLMIMCASVRIYSDDETRDTFRVRRLPSVVSDDDHLEKTTKLSLRVLFTLLHSSFRFCYHVMYGKTSIYPLCFMNRESLPRSFILALHSRSPRSSSFDTRFHAQTTQDLHTCRRSTSRCPALSDLDADSPPPPHPPHTHTIGPYLHGGGYYHLSAYEKSATFRIPGGFMKVRFKHYLAPYMS